jgi:hypothetical protein
MFTDIHIVGHVYSQLVQHTAGIVKHRTLRWAEFAARKGKKDRHKTLVGKTLGICHIKYRQEKREGVILKSNSREDN